MRIRNPGTRLVEETQERLLGLLEDLTTGTEEETRAFMRCCVETLARYPPADHLTPVFIFERLCSLIYPEEAETGEFFLALEKDPQQEEFLQAVLRIRIRICGIHMFWPSRIRIRIH